MTKKKDLKTYYLVSGGDDPTDMDTFLYTKEDLLGNKDYQPEGDECLWEIKVVRKCKITTDIVDA